MTAARPVVLGARALGEAEWAGRGVARYVEAHVRALQELAPDRIACVDHDRPGDARGAASGAGAFHVMSPFDPVALERVWPAWARAGDVALVVTLYDLIPLRRPDLVFAGPGAERARAAHRARLELVRRADAVLAISDATAADAQRLLGIDADRIQVISAASPRRGVRPATRLPGRVRGAPLLTVGGSGPRKNLPALVRAHALLPPATRGRHPLVICGRLSEAECRKLEATAGALGAARDLVLLGEVDDAVLEALYRRCALFVLASLDEGFGLPALEALQAGAAVIVADLPSLREVVADPAARFDPRSQRAMRLALERWLADPSPLARAASELARPFTWDRVVQHTLTGYDAALRRRLDRRRVAQRPPRSRPARIGLLTPFPPTRTGIATYSARLAEALAQRGPVEVYADGERDVTQLPSPAAGIRLARTADLDWRRAAGAAPAVLHCLGASPFHIDAWRSLMRHGGDVLLHDVRLLPLYAHLHERGVLGPDGFRAALRRMAGDLLGEELLRDLPPWTSPRLIESRAYLVGEVVDRSRRVLVHNEAARRLVLAERPDRGDDVRVVPFGLPAPVPALARREDGLVVLVGHARATQIAVAAAARAVARRPGTRFAFVGWPGPATLRLRELLARAGLAEGVTVDTAADDAAYVRWLHRAQVAVQVRDGAHHGESSATVGDCLSAGVPAIVNDHPAHAFAPDDAVLRLGREVAPEVLADAVVGLLDDPDRREALSQGALAFARRTSFVVAADALEAALA